MTNPYLKALGYYDNDNEENPYLKALGYYDTGEIPSSLDDVPRISNEPPRTEEGNVGFFQKARSGISRAVSKVADIFRRDQEEPQFNIPNQPIQQPKIKSPLDQLSFSLEPSRQESSAQLSPEVEKAGGVLNYSVDNALQTSLEDKLTKAKIFEDRGEIDKAEKYKQEADQIIEVSKLNDDPVNTLKKLAYATKLSGDRGLSYLKVGTKTFVDNLLQASNMIFEREQKRYEKLSNIPVVGSYYKKLLATSEETKQNASLQEERRKKLENYIFETSPTNPTFAGLVLEGAPSMGGFMLLSALTGGGAIAPAAMESLMEAANVYDDLRKNNKSIAEASAKADKTFLANMVLNYFTDKFGVFSERADGVIKKAILSAPMEGVQEGTQQLIQNIAEGKDNILEGVLESAGVGAVLGGVGGGIEGKFDRPEIVINDKDRNIIITPRKETQKITPKDEIIKVDQPELKVEPIVPAEDQRVDLRDENMKKVYEEKIKPKLEEIKREKEAGKIPDDYITVLNTGGGNWVDTDVEGHIERIAQHEPKRVNVFVVPKSDLELTGDYTKDIAGIRLLKNPVENYIKKERVGKREIVKIKKPEGVKEAIAIIRPDGTAGMDVKVDEKYRGKGLGTKVVKELENKLIEREIEKVRISALDDSVGFWKKLGYKVVGEKKYGNVPMEKRLIFGVNDLRVGNKYKNLTTGTELIVSGFKETKNGKFAVDESGTIHIAPKGFSLIEDVKQDKNKLIEAGEKAKRIAQRSNVEEEKFIGKSLEKIKKEMEKHHNYESFYDDYILNIKAPEGVKVPSAGSVVEVTFNGQSKPSGKFVVVDSSGSSIIVKRVGTNNEIQVSPKEISKIIKGKYVKAKERVRSSDVAKRMLEDLNELVRNNSDFNSLEEMFNYVLSQRVKNIKPKNIGEYNLLEFMSATGLNPSNVEPAWKDFVSFYKNEATEKAIAFEDWERQFINKERPFQVRNKEKESAKKAEKERAKKISEEKKKRSQEAILEQDLAKGKEKLSKELESVEEKMKKVSQRISQLTKRGKITSEAAKVQNEYDALLQRREEIRRALNELDKTKEKVRKQKSLEELRKIVNPDYFFDKLYKETLNKIEDGEISEEKIWDKIPYEKAVNLAEEWLKDAGFKYDDERYEWYDSIYNEWTGKSNAIDIVVGDGHVGDVVREKVLNNKEILDDVVSEIIGDKPFDLAKKNAIKNIEKIAKWANVDSGALLSNLKTGGKTSSEILLNFVNGFEPDSELVEQWQRRLTGAYVRHKLTPYDLVNKRGLDESDVEEIRREMTRMGHEEANRIKRELESTNKSVKRSKSNKASEEALLKPKRKISVTEKHKTSVATKILKTTEKTDVYEWKDLRVDKGKIIAFDPKNMVFYKAKTELEDGTYKLVGKKFVKVSDEVVEYEEPMKLSEVKSKGKIDGEELTEAFKWASKFIPKDDYRPVLSSFRIELDNNSAYMVATDGYKLLRYKLNGKGNGDLLISREFFRKYKPKFSGTVELKSDGEVVSIKDNNHEFVVLHMKGNYPNYMNIISDGVSKTEYVVDRKELLEKTKKLSEYLSDTEGLKIDLKDNGIELSAIFDFNGKTITKKEFVGAKKSKVVSHKNIDASLLMPMNYEGQFRLNPKYLIDALSNGGDQVKLWIGEDALHNPVTIVYNDRGRITAPSGKASTGDFANIRELPDPRFRKIEFPELLTIAKELSKDDVALKKMKRAYGRMKSIEGVGGKIELNPEIFKDPVLAAKTMAHELGHLTDLLPEKTMKRGNIIGRLKSLRRYLKNTFGEEEIKNNEIRQELYELSKMWRPFNEREVTKGFLRYRKSSEELYADAISVLFNNPGLLKQKSPTFYEAFFDNLDKKPEVQQIIYDIQDMLSTGDEVLKKRHEDIRKMFQRAEDKFVAVRQDDGKFQKSVWQKLKHQFVTMNSAVIEKINELEKNGVKIPAEENPKYLLEEKNYLAGYISSFIDKHYNPIVSFIEENDLSWEDLGEYLFLERVVKERGGVENPIEYIKEHDAELYKKIIENLPKDIHEMSAQEQLRVFNEKFKESLYLEKIKDVLPAGIANPLGYDVKTAKRQLEFLKKKLGDKSEALESAVKMFRNVNQKIVDMASEEGLYSPELIAQMRMNPAYATFQVVEYLSDYVSPMVAKQVGTLKDVANPATATMMKNIAILRAIEINKTKRSVVNLLKTYYEDEIDLARKRWIGKRFEYLEPKDKTQGLIKVLENGKLKGYYVDKYIADVFKYSGVGTQNFVLEVFRLTNRKWFRPVFTTMNLGFQTFNLSRDFWRFWRNVPDMTIFKALKRYKEAFPHAYNRAFGKSDELITQMKEDKILNITYNQLSKGETDDANQLNHIMEKYDAVVLKNTRKRRVFNPINKVLDLIEKTGDLIETLPKVAGYIELKDKMPKEELAHFIRTKVGSPDFLDKGSSYQWSNNVFLFSNAMIQGIRADLAVATNPRTRSGFWIKTILREILPKMFIRLAVAGFFGKKLKEMYEKISEYDKTNYTPIAVGLDKNSKVVYVRVPDDETGRMIGGMFWKIISTGMYDRNIADSLAQILSYAGGQAPSIHPLISGVGSTFQYIAGQNPYDFFRGRNVLTEDQYKAGGVYSLLPFLEWEANNMGLGMVLKRKTYYEAPASKTLLEKVVELPVLSNIAGRWLKVSNYGVYEKRKILKKKIERESSIKRLETNKLIEKYVDKYNKQPSILNKRKLERELVQEVLGDRPDKADKTRLLKKFRISVLRGNNDPDINAVISANTNAEKIRILESIKKDKGPKEYRRILSILKEYKVISKDVYRKVR